jgi:predicted nucleic acid-binding protein
VRDRLSIIAATAELAGRTVLDLDKAFDVIADITGQTIERLKVRKRVH